jgi:hypothetical protein
MGNIDALQSLVGTQVTAMIEVRVGSDWRMVFSANGVLSEPYAGGTWDVGNRAMVLLEHDPLLDLDGRIVTATFNGCRVRIGPDPPLEALPG